MATLVCCCNGGSVGHRTYRCERTCMKVYYFAFSNAVHRVDNRSAVSTLSGGYIHLILNRRDLLYIPFLSKIELPSTWQI
jgi:hypothetical protein